MSDTQQAPATPEHEPMLRYFKFDHLPPHLRPASAPWWDLACIIVATVPRNAERTVALRKLLEGKDCAVRAMLPPEDAVPRTTL